MATKHSKATLTLLAQFPTFDDWIINNLTPDQLVVVMKSTVGKTSFGDGHPLNSQKLCVQLWRAYKRAVLFELEYRSSKGWGYSSSLAHPDRLAYFHRAVCIAIGLYLFEQPELLDKAVERTRREIADSAGPAQSPTNPQGSLKRRNRL